MKNIMKICQFKNDLCLYASPALDPDTNNVVNLKNLDVPENLQHLYQHLIENRNLRPLNSINHDYLNIYSHEVLADIQNNKTGWENKLPAKVASLIKDRHLFGHA